MTISGRIETARRERRVLPRVFCAAWRLDQAERERMWAWLRCRAGLVRSAGGGQLAG